MAEEQGAQPIEEAAGAPNGTEPTETERDWKAEYEKLLKHSRTWEDKAKRLKEKADRYDELEEASKSDAEKLADATRRAEEAEAKVADYERRAERADAVAEVAAEKGVDAEWLARMSGDTREEIEANADFIASKLESGHIYPSVPDKGLQRAPQTSEEDVRAIKDPAERIRARARLSAQKRK